MNINVQSKHFWLNLLLLVLQGVMMWVEDELEKNKKSEMTNESQQQR